MSCEDDFVNVWNMDFSSRSSLRADVDIIINRVAIPPSSTLIACGTFSGGEVIVWELVRGMRWGQIYIIPDTEVRSSIQAVVFSPNGEMLATGSDDEKINMYSVAIGFSRMHTLEGHTNTIYSLSFSPNNTRLVSCSGEYNGTDLSIRLWNVMEGTLVKKVDHYHVSVAAHSSNGSLIASGSGDCTIKIWDAGIEVRDRRHKFNRKRP